MFEVWRRNIRENLELVRAGRGPSLVSVVSGSESDRAYWQRHFEEVGGHVFNAGAAVPVHSFCEGRPKGNFLGTLLAWAQIRASEGAGAALDSGVALMSMVFGKGKRLSPFTQSLGNRKPAFLTPRRAGNSGLYMNTADLSNLFSASWVDHLREGGFRGLLVKWGDEAIIPGTLWPKGARDFRDVDAVRFVWQTEPTETLAREKDWFLIEGETGLINFALSRQEMDSLRSRLGALARPGQQAGVNLGSLALSYDFLDLALEIFHDEVFAPSLSADWDPYVWLALFCRDESDWRAEQEHETRLGRSGIRALEERFPGFYRKLARLRGALAERTGRPLRVGALNFGEAFWVDIGLHAPLRRCLESLITETEEGRASRDVFGIPHERDARGNVVVNSSLPDAADIRDSVVVDSVILDPHAVVRGGVVVGSRLRSLRMPHGGSALFCAADELSFTGPRGIAFASVSPAVMVREGGRHTTLWLPQGPQDFVSNEDIWDYGGENYQRPILGNPLSFEEAGELMSKVDGLELDARRAEALRDWLR